MRGDWSESPNYMARIRTIKPEFFTSEDTTSLTPLARLLYVALWCEADRDGRMEWKPGTFKLRYLPADNCDIRALCAEIVSRGLVVLYGNGLARIPKFSTHQHINPREAASSYPPPDESDDGIDACARVDDASLRVSDAQGGREGKGKEGDKDRPPTGDLLGESNPDCPQKQIVELYHEILPELPPVNEWTAQNSENLRTRWRSAPDRRDVAWWRGFFEYVRKCPFLMGGKTDFQASLGWLVKAGNFAKVLNGQYEERRAAA